MAELKGRRNATNMRRRTGEKLQNVSLQIIAPRREVIPEKPNQMSYSAGTSYHRYFTSSPLPALKYAAQSDPNAASRFTFCVFMLQKIWVADNTNHVSACAWLGLTSGAGRQMEL